MKVIDQLKQRITLRPTTPEDQEFLFRVYASTREDELARVDWDEVQKERFMRMQFDAQDTYYRENYPGYEFQVILADGHPPGGCTFTAGRPRFALWILLCSRNSDARELARNCSTKSWPKEIQIN